MSRSRTKLLRRLGWLPLAAGFALMPKCLVCLAAYAGVGALLGIKLGGPEICGATASPAHEAIAWVTIAAAGLISFGFGHLILHRLRRRRVGHRSASWACGCPAEISTLDPV